MQVFINGQSRTIDFPHPPATVAGLVAVLSMQADRVAIEQNGEIVTRAAWGQAGVQEGDRFEIVHFVGGGCR